MRKNKLFIYGTGGHAKVVFYIAQLMEYEIGGFLDDTKEGEYLGLPILKPEVFFKQKNPNECEVFVGIGNTAIRKEKVEIMIKHGFILATLIHTNSIVAKDVKIGKGSVLMAGSIVNPGTRIGNNCIVNTNASVDHDCYIADFVHLAPGVTRGGGVIIKEESWIGIGACVREYRTIGKGVIIGMGAAVVKDIADNVVAFGVPAEIKQKNL